MKAIKWTGLLLAGVLMAGTGLALKHVNWDSARGILAAKQFEAGRSSTIVTLAVADQRSLAREYFLAEAWRSPGYQALPFVWRMMNLSWGAALQASVMVVVVFGLAGWWVLYARVMPGRHWYELAFLLLVLSPDMMSNIGQYRGGDLLLFGVAPWTVLLPAIAATRFDGRVGPLLALAGGVLVTGTVLLKYSGVFLAFGLAGAWIWMCWHNHRLVRSAIYWAVGAVIGAAAVLLLGYPWGQTPATATGRAIDTASGIKAMAMWPCAMTGTGDILQVLARRTELSAVSALGWIIASVGWVSLVGVGAILLRRAFRSSRANLSSVLCADMRRKMLATFAIGAAVGDILLYSGMVLLGADVEVSTRLARISGLLLLPFVLAIAMTAMLQKGAFERAIGFCILVGVILPGPVFGAYRLVRTGVDWAENRKAVPMPDGIWNPYLGAKVDQGAFYRELRELLPSDDTVLTVTQPEMLFPIPRQRCLLVYVIDKGYTEAELRALRFRGDPPGGVAILAPVLIETDGRLSALEAAFVEVHGWERVRMKTAPQWILCRGGRARVSDAELTRRNGAMNNR